MVEEGEFKKRIDMLVEKSGWLQYSEAMKDTLIMLDEAKKELFDELGSSHYSISKKRFVKGIRNDEELVLVLEKWFGSESSQDIK